jgi:hypothetical protein
MGADTIQRLPTSVPVIAFSRSDFPFDFESERRSNPDFHVVQLEHHFLSLSSTKCRELIRCGAWDELVECKLLPGAVVNVLRERQHLKQCLNITDRHMTQISPPNQTISPPTSRWHSSCSGGVSFPHLSFPSVSECFMQFCCAGASSSIDDDSHAACTGVEQCTVDGKDAGNFTNNHSLHKFCVRP